MEENLKESEYSSIYLVSKIVIWIVLSLNFFPVFPLLFSWLAFAHLVCCLLMLIVTYLWPHIIRQNYFRCTLYSIPVVCFECTFTSFGEQGKGSSNYPLVQNPWKSLLIGNQESSGGKWLPCNYQARSLIPSPIPQILNSRLVALTFPCCYG